VNDVEVRIKCLEAIMPTASKIGLTTGEIFNIAEEAFKFVTKVPGEKPLEYPKGSKGK
jgi:hypothetical protein